MRLDPLPGPRPYAPSGLSAILGNAVAQEHFLEVFTVADFSNFDEILDSRPLRETELSLFAIAALGIAASALRAHAG